MMMMRMLSGFAKRAQSGREGVRRSWVRAALGVLCGLWEVVGMFCNAGRFGFVEFCA